ncbi:MAG: acyltransferase family protein [Pseudomonadota bacterium]
MNTGYRPDIDGLRTVAVGSVLIYHLDLYVAGRKVFEGGFLGVDIFFVISGFLIAGLIRKDYLDTGRFSLLDFYERRARRLLPALFVVIGASFVAAAAILPATAMMDFAVSALAAIGFVSNIYWLAESQIYGAQSGLIAPLLHTWSLAVEEQFYLVFPLIYIAVLARVRRGLAAVGLGAIAAGFVLALVLTRWDFSFSFYMLFARIWELLAGAVLAHALAARPALGQAVPLRWALPSLGLVLIAGSLLTTGLRDGHPGLATLPVIVGTVLIIWFARPTDPVTRLLASRPFVAVGLISYALYLWHYPIYAFGRRLALMEPGPVDYAAWVALSFAAATATYYLVEQPFRRRNVVTRPVMIASLCLGAVAILGASVFTLDRDGAPGRLTGIAALYGPANPDNLGLRAQSWDLLNDRLLGFGDAKPSLSEHAHSPSHDEATRLWFDPDSAAQKVLIVGDSHAKDMYNMLSQNLDILPGIEVARFGMAVEIKTEHLDALQASPNFAAADTVLVSFRYRRFAMDDLPLLLDVLAQSGKQVVLTSRAPEFEADSPFTTVDLALRRDGKLDRDAVEALAWATRTVTPDHPTNQRLADYAEDYGFMLLDKEPLLCDRAAERCTMVTPDGRKMHFDYGHYTMHGAAVIGQRIADMNWLAPLDQARTGL